MTWSRDGSEIAAVTASSDETRAGGIGFDTLIADISARLVAAPGQTFASAIETALEETARFFGADSAELLSVHGSESALRSLHAWRVDTVNAGVPVSRFADHLPWAADLILNKRQPLVMGALAELPPQARRDRASFAARGVRSAVWVPIAIGQELPYVLSIESTRNEVHWPLSSVNRLTRLGEILAHLAERQRVVVALQETHNRITLAILSADAGVWDFDMSTGHIWATPAAKRLYGFDADDEVTHEAFLSVLHPEDVDRIQERVAHAAAGGEFVEEYRVVLPAGGVRWIAARGRVQVPTDGSGLHIFGLSVDVTARTLAEAEHRANIGRLEAAVDAAGLGFYVTSDHGETTFADDRTRDLAGIPAGMEPKVRTFWLEHVHPDDKDAVLQASRDLYDGGAESLSRDYRYLHPTRGLRWLHHTIRAFERDPVGRPTRAAGVIQDITEQKRTEEELRTLSRHLIQAQEAERAILARDLHDDITQRLALLAIEVGRAESSAPGSVQTATLGTVREGLVQLSEDIHSLAYRLHPAVLEELGLVAALRTECERRGRHAGIDVTLDLDPVPAAVGKDATLCLYRVAQEALNNVARHARARTATLVLRPIDGGLLLAIRDDGVGFNPDESRAKRSLGLVSMRERLRLVNGTLDVESAPGQGTSIVAWVPGEGGAP